MPFVDDLANLSKLIDYVLTTAPLDYLIAPLVLISHSFSMMTEYDVQL